MGNRRSRWLDLLAAIVVTWIVAAAWWAWPGEAPQGRVELLRAAFDRASTQCYDSYRGMELQACLAGAMEAHLHALGGVTEEPDESEVTQARLARRL